MTTTSLILSLLAVLISVASILWGLRVPKAITMTASTITFSTPTEYRRAIPLVVRIRIGGPMFVGGLLTLLLPIAVVHFMVTSGYGTASHSAFAFGIWTLSHPPTLTLASGHILGQFTIRILTGLVFLSASAQLFHLYDAILWGDLPPNRAAALGWLWANSPDESPNQESPDQN